MACIPLNKYTDRFFLISGNKGKFIASSQLLNKTKDIIELQLSFAVLAFKKKINLFGRVTHT